MQQLTDDTRTDGRVFRFGKKKDSLDTTQLTVDVSNAFFILKVLDRTDTTENYSRSLFLSEIHGQSAIGNHLDTRFVGINLTDAFQTLLDRHQATLAFVDANADDDFIHKG